MSAEQVTAYRLAARRYAETALSGEGAALLGGRWNSPGVRVVYASEHLSLAVLEVLVRLESTAALAGFVAVAVTFPRASVRRLVASELPARWDAPEPTRATQKLGDAFVASAEAPVLAVPSTLVPTELNFVINIGHSDAAGITMGSPIELVATPRLAGLMRLTKAKE